MFLHYLILPILGLLDCYDSYNFYSHSSAPELFGLLSELNEAVDRLKDVKADDTKVKHLLLPLVHLVMFFHLHPQDSNVNQPLFSLILVFVVYYFSRPGSRDILLSCCVDSFLFVDFFKGESWGGCRKGWDETVRSKRGTVAYVLSSNQLLSPPQIRGPCGPGSPCHWPPC